MGARAMWVALVAFALCGLSAFAGPVCQLTDDVTTCGYVQAHDCSDSWSYYLSSESGDVAMIAWFGTFAGNVQTAVTCTSMDDCDVCMNFADVDFAGDAVSASVSVTSSGDGDDCEMDALELGEVSSEGLDCCDPNYHRLPIGFDIDDISIFDFLDDSDYYDYYYDDDYEYEEARARPSSTAFAAARGALSAVNKRVVNQSDATRDARDPPDMGISFENNCWLVMGVPMFCNVPTMSVCNDEPAVNLFPFLGFVLEFDDFVEDQQQCVSVQSGADLCLNIDSFALDGSVVSYVTYISMGSMELSGRVPLTFTFDECSCANSVSESSLMSSEGVNPPSPSFLAVSSGAQSNSASTVIDEDDNDNEGNGEDNGEDNGDVETVEDGDDGSGISAWSWLWSIIVGAVLLTGCVVIGIIVALVIGGVVIFKKKTATVEEEPDYNLDEYA